LNDLNDARDEGLRVFLYLSCLKTNHVYHTFPHQECSGLQLLLSLLDSNDDITALLSTRSLLVLLVSLTSINEEFEKQSIRIFETCIPSSLSLPSSLPSLSSLLPSLPSSLSSSLSSSLPQFRFINIVQSYYQISTESSSIIRYKATI